ncbi:MAG: biotin transporter BioY [Coriobacteriia bacterium]|nr:biotin transporter BioY [Coriobacteriia bacterium]
MADSRPGPTPGSGRTRDLAAAALLTALLSASAYLVVPLTPVPFTLQVFFVVLAGLLLSPGWAAASMGAYLALGAAGIPVFSGGRGGLGVLAGPTGGYLIGFLLGAVAASLIRSWLGRTALRPIASDSIAAGTAVFVIYACGVAQLMGVADLSLAQAVVSGVAPFIVFDVAKAVAAVAVAGPVRKARTR